DEHTSNAVTVTIDVTPVNDAPDIESVPEQSATEGQTFTLDLADYVSDVENDPLEFSASGLPPGLDVDPSSGVVSGRVDTGIEARDYEVEVTVDDGDDTSRSSFVVAVVMADRADLEAAVEATPNPALVDEAVTWTLTVINRGDVDVANVSLDAEFSG